jgi:polyisoprenoid-binding protein YceI
MTAPTRTLDGVTIPGAGTFNVDPVHSSIGFVVRHLMVSKVRGSFAEFGGSITIGEDPLASAVTATIQAASLSTGAADRDAHVRGPEFLDVENYPTLTFVSTGLKGVGGAEFVLTGDLTIRDVTKQVELKLEFDGVATNPWGKEVIAFTASTEIDREEFGVMWNAAMETGGVVVSKNVKIEISGEAVRQD